MKRILWLVMTFAVPIVVAQTSFAQTNSYISATDGFWDEARLWSLTAPPDMTQSGIFITNAASVNVTIDNVTASEFPGTMTISNLNLATPFTGDNSTLYLKNTGTVALHVLSGLTIGFNADFIQNSIGGSTLISSNSSLVVDGMSGGELRDNGTVMIVNGTLITTNCSLTVAQASTGLSGNSGTLIVSNSIVRARDISISSGTPPAFFSGSMNVFGSTVTLSSSLTVGSGNQPSGASVLLANGTLLVVTNGFTLIGGSFEGGDSITVTNSTFLGADVVLGGERSQGNLIINNSTVALSGELDIGTGDQGSGYAVSLNGGALIVTNGTIYVGDPGGQVSNAQLSIANGLFLARDLYVGDEQGIRAFLNIGGGTSILSSNLQVGTGASSGPLVTISGGQLVVTNAPITVGVGGDTFFQAQIEVSGGFLTACSIEVGGGNGGLDTHGILQVDSGSVTASTGIQIGDCEIPEFGTVTINGGQVIVTNATHTGFVDLRTGQLALNGGTLQVDQLIMTNSFCVFGLTEFSHTGGTLIVGKVVLDPNAFRIVSVTRQSNDVLVSWLMAPGATNALQAANGGPGYSTNGFMDIFVVTNNTSAGVLTNYLDVGGATNGAARFYRARLGL